MKCSEYSTNKFLLPVTEETILSRCLASGWHWELIQLIIGLRGSSFICILGMPYRCGG
jgi:hypothetical protein